MLKSVRSIALLTACVGIPACGSDNDDHLDGGIISDAPSIVNEFVYIETNDPAANGILGFAAGPDGNLTALSSPVPTGGIGITAGPDQRIGPLDSDHQVVLSADKQTLFAVNAGDNTVATYSTSRTGALTATAGSPFPGSGPNPVSIGLVGAATLIDVNKAVAGNVSPSYRTLAVRSNGLATAAIITNTPVGGSPTTSYVSSDQRFLFGTEFFDGARVAQTPTGQIDAFTIGAAGLLVPVPGAPYALPADTSGITPTPLPVALNVIQHPTQALLYVGFPTRSQIGVYAVDPASGALTFLRAVASSGKTPGWFAINRAGTRMYVVNSDSATLSFYDLTNPQVPVEVSAITMKNAVAGPPFTDASNLVQTDTSLPFQLTLSADERHLWVISQRVTTNATDPLGNFIHVLAVAADGSLSEPGAPIDLTPLGVPPTARPQGIVSFTP